MLVYTWLSISDIKYDIKFILRSQFFEYLPETFYKHASEQLNVARPEKQGSCSSYGKCLTIIDLFERLWLVGTHFRR